MSGAYDLDLANYTLDDLLGLFKLEYPIDDHSLRKARKIVVHTHPDKSGLDSSLFLFFTAAYSTLERLISFQNKGKRGDQTEYSAEVLDEERIGETLKDRADFGEVFNRLFEAHMEPLHTQEGHGEWLSGGATSTTNHTSEAELQAKKQELRSLVVRTEVQGVSSGLGTELATSNELSYGTGTLAYDDVRKVYTETVIPVTRADFESRQQFSNVESLRSARVADMQSAVRTNHKAILKKQWQAADIANLELALELEQRDRVAQTRKNNLGSQLLLLDQK